MLVKGLSCVCLLYGIDHIIMMSMMYVRYQLFSTKGAQSHLVPPTRDALHKHLLLENYQARIWGHEFEGMAEIPIPQGHGWLLKDEALTVDWMNELTAPFAVHELMIYRCTKKCEGNRFSCRRNQLPCYCSDDCENQSGENKQILRSDSDNAE